VASNACNARRRSCLPPGQPLYSPIYKLRAAGFRPKETILLRFQFFQRHSDQREIDIVHRQRPMPVQDIDMFLRRKFGRKILSDQPIEKLTRQAFRVLQVLALGEFQLTSDVRDHREACQRENPARRHGLRHGQDGRHH
jgi:hypothetical protein